MRATIDLHVEGRPAPKGSRRYYGNGRSAPDSKYEKAWTGAVALKARAERVTLDAPYRVEVEFRIKPGARNKYAWPVQSDLDKLVRATLDGLVVGQLIDDDAHVTEIVARKRFVKYAHEGAGITVESLA